MQNNNRNVDKLIDAASKKLGTDKQELKNAIGSGSIENILNNLNSADAQKIRAVLQNKSAADKLMQSPEAKALMQKLMEGK